MRHGFLTPPSCIIGNLSRSTGFFVLRTTAKETEPTKNSSARPFPPDPGGQLPAALREAGPGALGVLGRGWKNAYLLARRPEAAYNPIVISVLSRTIWNEALRFSFSAR